MTHLVCLAAVALACAACSRSAPPAPAAAPVAAAPAEHGEQLDPRTPVPLLAHMANHQKQNMRDHLVVVQEIVAALGSDDFAAIEQAAARIGYSDQMGAMCTHMGAGAPGFAEQAVGFHKTADGILAAAKQRDRAAVIQKLDATLQTCTSCHAQWRQQIVDEATFAKLTQG